MVECLITALQESYCSVWQQNDFENRLAFGKVRDKNRVAPFFRTQCSECTSTKSAALTVADTILQHPALTVNLVDFCTQPLWSTFVDISSERVDCNLPFGALTLKVVRQKGIQPVKTYSSHSQIFFWGDQAHPEETVVKKDS